MLKSERDIGFDIRIHGANYTSAGSEFQRMDAATGNDRRPMVACRWAVSSRSDKANLCGSNKSSFGSRMQLKIDRHVT
jgi:hypothetical protein